MKNISRLLALVLALCLILPGMALAQDINDAAAADPVLFTFDGTEVPLSEVNEALNYLIGNGYLYDYDYEYAIEFLIENKLFEKQIGIQGFDKFTEDEEEAFLMEAQITWNAIVENNIPYFLSEDTEEGRQLAKETVESLMYLQGINLDAIVAELKNYAAYDRMMATFDADVTEEEVRAAFNADCEFDKMYFENNQSYYEYCKYYQGYDPLYIPSDFRSVIHILLNVDDELLTAYQNAQAMLEEGEEADAAVTQADVDAAKAAILASRQTEIDDIYSRLEKGESFESLIAVYGEDPGMKNEEGLKEGYYVNKDSIAWDPVFSAAAMSEKMQKPGDVSDPVVGSNGIHILYYLKDIPAGNAELTEAVYAEIEASLVNEKINMAYSDALIAWRNAAEIVYNEENIAAAINEINAALEAAEAAEAAE